MTTRVLLSLGLGAVVGCFTPPSSPVLFACDPDGAAACPEGYACQIDGCCHRIGSDYEQHEGECRLGAGDGPPATTTPGSTGTSDGASETDSTGVVESTGSTTDAESTTESTSSTTDAESTSSTTDAESTSDTSSTESTETGDSGSTSTTTDTT